MASLVPDDFIFGVATAGFQIEGGYNGLKEPANNWSEWEALGRVEPSGIALDFWNRYKTYLELAKSIGVNSFRLSVEWTRCVPEQNKVDQKAIKNYQKILAAFKDYDLEPLITLHHFCHPIWLGVDFWLNDKSPEIFSNWVKIAVENFGDFSNKWVTINEPNIYNIMSYALGQFPPGKFLNLKKTLKAIDNLYSAHIKAYETIKGIQPDSIVGINNLCFSIYEMDKLFIDILLSRLYKIEPKDLIAWLKERKARYYQLIISPNIFETFSRKFIEKITNYKVVLKNTRKLLQETNLEKVLDVIQIDFYNPLASSHLRLPGHKTAGGRSFLPARMLWDDLINPDAFLTYLKANNEENLPLWVVENGMGTRVKNGRAYPRGDGWDRATFIKQYLSKIPEAIKENINLKGYWHWTLADNYEWGSYEPRFGIFGVDRERGLKVLPTDVLGYDAKGAYKEMIEQLRNSNVS